MAPKTALLLIITFVLCAGFVGFGVLIGQFINFPRPRDEWINELQSDLNLIDSGFDGINFTEYEGKIKT